MTSQTPETRPAPRWKVLVIASASAGAGFALIVAVIVGSVFWYVSRPRPPKAWDTRAVSAKYRDAVTEDSDCFVKRPNPTLTPDEFFKREKACESANGQVLLTYELQNRTEYDYRIQDQSNLEIMERREKVLWPKFPGRAAFLNVIEKDVSFSKVQAAHPEITKEKFEKDFAAAKAGGEIPKYMYDGLVDVKENLPWTLQTPVFVPAERTVVVDIKGPYTCAGCTEDKLKSVVKDIPELVLFDSSTRYQIEFPKPQP